MGREYSMSIYLHYLTTFTTDYATTTEGNNKYAQNSKYQKLNIFCDKKQKISNFLLLRMWVDFFRQHTIMHSILRNGKLM